MKSPCPKEIWWRQRGSQPPIGVVVRCPNPHRRSETEQKRKAKKRKEKKGKAKKRKANERTNAQTNERTDERTDERTNGVKVINHFQDVRVRITEVH